MFVCLYVWFFVLFCFFFSEKCLKAVRNYLEVIQNISYTKIQKSQNRQINCFHPMSISIIYSSKRACLTCFLLCWSALHIYNSCIYKLNPTLGMEEISQCILCWAGLNLSHFCQLVGNYTHHYKKKRCR